MSAPGGAEALFRLFQLYYYDYIHTKCVKKALVLDRPTIGGTMHARSDNKSFFESIVDVLCRIVALGASTAPSRPATRLMALLALIRVAPNACRSTVQSEVLFALNGRTVRSRRVLSRC
jgi:hypothetical protein